VPDVSGAVPSLQFTTSGRYRAHLGHQQLLAPTMRPMTSRR